MERELTAEEFDRKNILDAVLEMGRRMVQSGAEVNRVEDTMHRILTAYGAVSVEAFSISSMVLCTVKWPDDQICTQSKRIVGYGINLRKLELYNALSRSICSKLISPDEFKKKLKEIAKSRKRDWVDAVCYMLSAGSLAMFFGGGWMDTFAAGVIGLVVFFFDKYLKTPKSNTIVYTMFACLVCGVLTILSVRLGFGHSISAIQIGIVFLFIPTLAFCNSIKDMLYGDLLTGMHRLLEAVLVTMAMTAGFYIAKILMASPSVAIPSIPINVIPWYEQLILAFIGTMGFAVYFRIRRRRKIWEAAIGGTLGWAVYLLVYRASQNLLLSNAVAAIVIEFYAETAARLWKAPANIFLIPSVIPILPGASFYRCMSGLISTNEVQFIDAGKDFFLSVSGIELGFLIAFIVFTRSAEFVKDGIEYTRRRRAYEGKTSGRHRNK